jgi:hypothetical protein
MSAQSKHPENASQAMQIQGVLVHAGRWTSRELGIHQAGLCGEKLLPFRVSAITAIPAIPRDYGDSARLRRFRRLRRLRRLRAISAITAITAISSGCFCLSDRQISRTLSVYLSVNLRGGAPYFFQLSQKTKALSRFRPLGHAEFALGSRRDFLGSPNVFLGSPKGQDSLAQKFRFTTSLIARLRGLAFSAPS